jgi:hypothetical protein
MLAAFGTSDPAPVRHESNKEIFPRIVETVDGVSALQVNQRSHASVLAYGLVTFGQRSFRGCERYIEGTSGRGNGTARL